MSSKLTTSLCMAAIFFLLFLSLTLAGRPIPAPSSSSSFSTSSSSGTPNEVLEAERVNTIEGSCEGAGEEECLIRRTLAAHLDYIYTQKQNP